MAKDGKRETWAASFSLARRVIVKARLPSLGYCVPHDLPAIFENDVAWGMGDPGDCAQAMDDAAPRGEPVRDGCSGGGDPGVERGGWRGCGSRVGRDTVGKPAGEGATAAGSRRQGRAHWARSTVRPVEVPATAAGATGEWSRPSLRGVHSPPSPC